MKILIGTNNLNKFKNYKDAFCEFASEVEVLNPNDLKISDDVEEDGKSLLENAIKKAKFFADKSGILTLADDTGLFVDALIGEPGIHTKRWHSGSDHDRCVKLLERLEGKIKLAKYVWAFAAFNPVDEKLWTFQCELVGEIADKFKDSGGFGYDKMFKVPSLSKYYSELSIGELNKFGGRGRAVKEFVLNEFRNNK